RPQPAVGRCPLRDRLTEPPVDVRGPAASRAPHGTQPARTQETSERMALLALNSRRRPRTGAPRTRRGWRVTPWLFLLVPLVLLVTFTYLPVVNMISYSFTSWDGLDPEMKNVGWDNYVRIFTRPEILRVFLVSTYYLAGAILELVLALY